MQPTLRQVPPNVARFSTMATFMPELAGADGANIAAGPSADDDQIESGHSLISVHIPRGSGAPNAQT